MDREAWRAAVHGVGKSRTWLSMHQYLELGALTAEVSILGQGIKSSQAAQKDQTKQNKTKTALHIFLMPQHPYKQMVSNLSRQLCLLVWQWWSCHVSLLILCWLWPSDMKNTKEILSCLWLCAPVWPLTKTLAHRSSLSLSALHLSTWAHSPQRLLVALWMASCASLKDLTFPTFICFSVVLRCVYTKPSIRILVFK